MKWMLSIKYIFGAKFFVFNIQKNICWQNGCWRRYGQLHALNNFNFVIRIWPMLFLQSNCFFFFIPYCCIGYNAKAQTNKTFRVCVRVVCRCVSVSKCNSLTECGEHVLAEERKKLAINWWRPPAWHVMW